MLTRLAHKRTFFRSSASSNLRSSHSQTAEKEDEFRVFDVRNRKRKEVAADAKYIRPPMPPSRELQMPIDQDWSNVWPGPRTFHPASVPLPLKQGRDRNGKKRIPPGKYANAELMKLPNFLHLTPPAVKKHCDALRKFCTPWPRNLVDDECVERHFPLRVISTDYCHSSSKIRDPKARVVTFQFKLSHLSLDAHSKDKIRRLLGDRHNDESDAVTLVADRCPLRKQNYDYNQYLLLALFYESWKTENWESEKVEEDMESYDWSRSRSRRSFLSLVKWRNRAADTANGETPNIGDAIDEGTLAADSRFTRNDVDAYKNAVSELFNRGENIENLFKYKESVLKIVH